MQGWIKLYRQILECDLWIGLDGEEDEPFDRRSAWIDLLLRANHRDKTFLFDGKNIVVGRGQLITSVRKLASRWHWGKDKTLRYLRSLENLNMIERVSDSRKTLITIVKYDVYQGEDDTDATVNRQLADSKQTVTSHKQEYKECKEVINIYMSFPLKDGTEYDIDEDFVNQMKELYPKVDVEKELLAMKGWLIGNPSKRKTKKGMPRFITGWLGRGKDVKAEEPKKDKFKNFEGREIDFDELEKELWGK